MAAAHLAHEVADVVGGGLLVDGRPWDRWTWRTAPISSSSASVRYTVDTWTSGTAAASSSAVNDGALAAHGVDHGVPRAPDAVAGGAQVCHDLVGSTS